MRSCKEAVKQIQVYLDVTASSIILPASFTGLSAIFLSINGFVKNNDNVKAGFNITSAISAGISATLLAILLPIRESHVPTPLVLEIAQGCVK